VVLIIGPHLLPDLPVLDQAARYDQPEAGAVHGLQLGHHRDRLTEAVLLPLSEAAAAHHQAAETIKA